MTLVLGGVPLDSQRIPDLPMVSTCTRRRTRCGNRRNWRQTKGRAEALAGEVRVIYQGHISNLLIWVFPQNSGFSPQIIHFVIGFSIIKFIHFGIPIYQYINDFAHRAPGKMGPQTSPFTPTIRKEFRNINCWWNIRGKSSRGMWVGS